MTLPNRQRIEMTEAHRSREELRAHWISSPLLNLDLCQRPVLSFAAEMAIDIGFKQN